MRRSVIGTGAALVIMAAATAAMVPFRPSLSIATTALVLVVPVVIGVVIGGFVAGVISVIAGFLVYDFVFIPPYLTLWVGRQAQNWVALGVYVAVMLPVARVVAVLNAARARERRQRTELRELFQLSGLLLQDKPLDELLPAVVTIVAEAFGSRQVALLLPREGQLEIAASAGPPLAAGVLDRLLATGDLDGPGAGPDLHGDVLVHSLTAAGRPVGLLVLSADSPGRPEREPLSLFANQVAFALERAQLREQALRTRLTDEVAVLAKTLVAAVSHDLRAPLARIKAASSTLADPEMDIDPQARQDLVALVDRQADRLADLVRNLLDMGRIQAGVLQPRREPGSLPKLVSGVLSDLAPGLRGHPVEVALPPDLPLVDVDATLIGRVLTNMLENAVRHAPRGTPIRISAAPGPEGVITVSVADKGPGVAPEQRDEIFGMLARRDSDAGAGLGLSIARTFVEAHGQRVWVAEAPGGGAQFCFTLPAVTSAGSQPSGEEAELAAGAHR